MNQLHSTPKHVLRGELLKRNMTLCDFARKYGYPQVSVLVAFNRHCGNYESNPRGKLTKEIVRKLYQEMFLSIEPPENNEPDQVVNQ